MRMRRLWLKNYFNLEDLEIEFQPHRWEASATSVRMFVGLNGTGKSNTLEAIGLIFSRLAVNAPPGIGFEIEYEVDGNIVLITTRQAMLEDLGLEQPSLRDVEVSLLVRPKAVGVWQPDHLRSVWPGPSSGLLPGKVVGYAGGPTSGMRDVLMESVEQLVRSQIGNVEAETRPASLHDEEWESYRESRRKEIQERVQAYLDNPLTLFLGVDDSMCAVLALLAHEGLAEAHPDPESYFQRRAELIKRVELRRDNPLPAFTLRVAGQWEQRLTPLRREALRTLLRMAAVRMPIDSEPPSTAESEPPPPDFYAVFDLDSTFRRQGLRKVASSPYAFFEALLAWKRNGAITDLRLLIKKPEPVRGLLPDNALSDGEYLFLGRYGLLLMLREIPDALILLDEPETHYNDRWKADMVKDICALLDRSEYEAETRGSSEVILATHSAIALSDVDHSQIILFKKAKGSNRIEVSHPRTPTFAADLSIIAGELTEQDNPVGSHAAEWLRDELRHHGDDVEYLHTLLDRVGPGVLRLEVMQAMRRAKPNAD